MSNWDRLAIAEKPVDVFVPSNGPPRFGLLFLHGFDGLVPTENATFARLLAEHRLACVAPHGNQCWWTDRVCSDFDPTLTAERHLLQNVLPYFAERWQLMPRSIGLVGVSMGGQGALRLAFKRPDLFPAVAALAPAIEYHELYWRGTPIDDMYESKEQARQDTAPMHVHPTTFPPHTFFACDPTDGFWYRGSDRLHEKLAALGVAHTCDLDTRAGGHTWAYHDHLMPRALGFVVAGLDRESRRLL